MKICSACRRCYEDTVLSCVEDNHDSLIEARSGSRKITANYRLEFLLECDAISETYTATNILLDEPCVVTTIDGNLTGAAQQLFEQFQSEARTAATIDHPNVVRVYESGILKSNEFYVVTEAVKGRTLREYSNSLGSPSEKNAVMIARQTAEGLEAAHAAGVPHRNLNPANIILTSSPENDFLIKIQNFDFGHVRQAAASAISDSEAHLAWLKYSSPEQCSAQTTDARTDIYSLGIVLYEMLEGRPPFDAPNAAELIHKQINEQPQPVKISNFDIRALLTHTLMLALQKSPTRRLQTVNALARQLRHIEQLVTRSPIPIPAQVFERISAPNTISSSAPVIQNNSFETKSGNDFFEELQPPLRETAKTITAKSAEAEQLNLLKETEQKEILVENISPSPPELIFAERKNAVDSQLASEFDSAESKLAENDSFEQETIQVEEEEFDCAGFAFESFRFENEFVVDASESESVISSPSSVKRTSVQPTEANLLLANGGGRGLWQTVMLKRPMIAGASLAALIVSAIIGLSLNEKFLYSDSQSLTAAETVPESPSLPKSEEITLNAARNTAITEEAEAEESEVPDVEKYAPVKFEKPVPTTPFRGIKKTESSKEKADNKTEAKQDASPDKKLAPEEKVNKTKAKQNTPSSKKIASKKRTPSPTEADIFLRPRKVEESGTRRKN